MISSSFPAVGADSNLLDRKMICLNVGRSSYRAVTCLAYLQYARNDTVRPSASSVHGLCIIWYGQIGWNGSGFLSQIFLLLTRNTSSYY